MLLKICLHACEMKGFLDETFRVPVEDVLNKEVIVYRKDHKRVQCGNEAIPE